MNNIVNYINYRSQKIHYILEKEGYQVIIKRVQRLMKKAAIQSITVKKFRPTPSKEKVTERENILDRDFSTKTINEKWVGDITYIYTLKHCWCYVAYVMVVYCMNNIVFSFY